MANKKRDRNGYRNEVGKHRLTRANLLSIEKILWRYSDAREMEKAGVSQLPIDRKHMPRRFIDRHVRIGRYSPFHFTIGWNEYVIHYPGVDWIYQEDSINLLSRHGYPKYARYLEIAAWPGIKIIIRPFSTVILAQTHYATGQELKVMREVVAMLEKYFSRLPKSKLNICRLR